jgi:hypothetical protein
MTLQKKQRTPTREREPRPGQLFIGIPEVAWLLGKSYDWCVRSPRPKHPRPGRPKGDGKSNLEILIAEFGFPKPRDFPGQPHWSREKVRAWIDEDVDISPLLVAGRHEPDYDAMLARRNAQLEKGLA